MTNKPFGNKLQPLGTHDALETLMELDSGLPSHFDAQSATAAPLWLGATLGQERIAIALNELGAVFKSGTTATLQATLAPLDLELHAGSPVFMTTLRALFEPTPGTPGVAASEHGEWVITRQHPHGSLLGCRVQTVHGPFYAHPESNDTVMFEGKAWTVFTPKGLTHG
jgi:hypothetical protein